MALSLRRRKIAPMPMPRQEFDTPMRRDADPLGPPGGDYLVEGEERPYRPSAVTQAAQLLQIVMIIVIAVLSLSVFWLLGLLLNIF
jgi:hypothetical protein